MYFIITMVFGVMIGITLNMFGQVTELLPEIIKNNFESGMVADHQTQSNQAKKKDKNIKYWVAPMDTNYRRNKPGKSPMGMDLIPVYEVSNDEQYTDLVKISPEVVNNLGVRTEKVTFSSTARIINAVGYIHYDENLISHVHLRTDGWIEKLLVKAEGAFVKEGELLFELYSPNLVSAQEEYLQSLTSGNKRLISASRERMRSLGIQKEQIRMLAKMGKVQHQIQVFAPRSGVVSALNVREGMHVKPSNVIMSVVDLANVWLIADVFERQSDWVRAGQKAHAKLSYIPGKLWQGKVDYVYPYLDPVTRTLKVRLKFDNPGFKLKPNMYAQVIIFDDNQIEALTIPREALIRSGLGERVVISLGDGRFETRDVTAGYESNDRVEILSGLSADEKVVTSAQFMIDSEASLKASFKRMKKTDKTNESVVAKKITGSAVINKIMLDKHAINLTHEPIDELGWPKMTMDLSVAENVNLDQVKVGNQIHFGLERLDSNQYIINMIQVVQ